MTDWVVEPEKQVRVVHETDICVLGGSCTGVFAAVRAAALGARVTIVERQNAFGGAAASAFVSVWHSLLDSAYEEPVIGGLTQETIERLEKRGAVAHVEKSADIGAVLNTEELKIELDGFVAENRITPFLHTAFAAPYCKDGRLLGVFVENKDGRGVILASRFIDATGDGDLCHRLGMESDTAARIQPPSATARLWGADAVPDLSRLIFEHGPEFGLPEDWGWRSVIPGIPGLSFHAETHIFDQDCAKAADLTAAEMEARRHIRAIMELIRKYGPPGVRVGLVGLPSCLGIRETRHIRCRHRLTAREVLDGVRFDDAIANGTYRVDIHQAGRPGIVFRYLDGREVYQCAGYPDEWSRWRPEGPTPPCYQIPYRSLVPADRRFDNVLLAGRMLDADEGAFGAARVMVNTNQMGEAAGAAAYLALDTGCGVAEVDTETLRRTLSGLGAMIR